MIGVGGGSYPGSARTSAGTSLASSRESSCASCPGITQPFRIAMVGAAGVGKTSLVCQFMTSESLHIYDASIGEYAVGQTSLRALFASVSHRFQRSKSVWSVHHLQTYKRPVPPFARRLGSTQLCNRPKSRCTCVFRPSVRQRGLLRVSYLVIVLCTVEHDRSVSHRLYFIVIVVLSCTISE